jgi:hypothetical protein
MNNKIYYHNKQEDIQIIQKRKARQGVIDEGVLY